jgi:hypothetical protein
MARTGKNSTRRRVVTDWAPHPDLLVSKTAADYLARPPTMMLSRKQIRRALQMADPNDKRVPDGLAVAALRLLFSAPPDWLREHHAALVAKGIPQVRHEVALGPAAPGTVLPQRERPEPRTPPTVPVPTRPALIPTFLAAPSGYDDGT